MTVPLVVFNWSPNFTDPVDGAVSLNSQAYNGRPVKADWRMASVASPPAAREEGAHYQMPKKWPNRLQIFITFSSLKTDIATWRIRSTIDGFNAMKKPLLNAG